MLQIEGKRIYLRDHIEDDFDFYHKWISNSRVMEFLDWKTNSVEESRTSFNDSMKEINSLYRKKYFFAVLEKNTKMLIGECGFTINEKDSVSAELGFFFLPENWGKGYAQEAISLLLKLGSESLEIKKFFGECATDNIASSKVMKKVGMKEFERFMVYYRNQGLDREKIRFSIDLE